MAINLTRIYTKTGDDGTTALGDMSRTRKTDPRLVAYADCDEANSAIGVTIALGQLPGDVVTLLIRIQNDLFDVGADLCTPVVPDPAYPPLRVVAEDVERLEAACDAYNETLTKLRSFVLPSGTPGAALLHVARTVVRRAERSTWAALEAARGLDERVDGEVPQPALRPAVHPGQSGEHRGGRWSRRRALAAGLQPLVRTAGPARAGRATC